MGSKRKPSLVTPDLQIEINILRYQLEEMKKDLLTKCAYIKILEEANIQLKQKGDTNVSETKSG
jgi:hypothetical protein